MFLWKCFIVFLVRQLKACQICNRICALFWGSECTIQGVFCIHRCLATSIGEKWRKNGATSIKQIYLILSLLSDNVVTCYPLSCRSPRKRLLRYANKMLYIVEAKTSRLHKKLGYIFVLSTLMVWRYSRYQGHDNYVHLHAWTPRCRSKLSFGIRGRKADNLA